MKRAGQGSNQHNVAKLTTFAVPQNYIIHFVDIKAIPPFLVPVKNPIKRRESFLN
jgi:hypothetical protein